MNSAGLKMYGDDYSSSSYDDRPDEVLNSGSDNDAPHQAGQVSEEDRCPKKLRISSLCTPGTTPVDGNDSDSSSLHTPAQKSKRAQQFTPPRSPKEYEIPPSDPESSELDQLFPDFPRGRKRGIKRVHGKWETGGSWSSQHVPKDDIRKEVARIMAKSMEDANNAVTTEQNAKAVSHFRQKTVSSPDLNCFFLNYLCCIF